MRRQYKVVNFRAEALDRINKANKIIAKYQAAGLRLTSRQLYYQFVTQNWITNEERSYKGLCKLISDARLAGLIDWAAIEDRGRQPDMPLHYSGLRDLADSALGYYRLDRWEDQIDYAELWVEKQALAGVLSPMAREYHVTLMVNKGYSSQSAMYDAAQRFLGSRRDPILFYLGDHDPSGEDMVRDIRERLQMFGVRDIRVHKVALTREQIEQYNPPPNPAKTTDSRYAKYAEEHGDESWEVDALPPDVLQDLIRVSFNNIIDKKKMDRIKKKEESDKKALTAAVADLED